MYRDVVYLHEERGRGCRGPPIILNFFFFFTPPPPLDRIKPIQRFVNRFKLRNTYVLSTSSMYIPGIFSHQNRANVSYRKFITYIPEKFVKIQLSIIYQKKKKPRDFNYRFFYSIPSESHNNISLNWNNDYTNVHIYNYVYLSDIWEWVCTEQQSL